MGKVLSREKRQKRIIEDYPGVTFDKGTKQFVATHKKDGVTYVYSTDTFKQAKNAQIQFENK